MEFVGGPPGDARPAARGGAFHGLEIPLRSAGGAQAVRVVHGPGQIIDPHRHDWACLTIPMLGRAVESWDGGEARIAGPCVVAHPPGACHSDHIGETGLETVSIRFDPKWLGKAWLDLRLDTSRCWAGGAVPAGARRLVSAWARGDSRESDLARSTAAFLRSALAALPAAAPAWLAEVDRALDGPDPVPTAKLAERLGLNPAWLARAYRAATGEGLQESARRRRAERAVPLLRRTSLPLAEVAAASGYCDQSHMNRDLRTLIGRTPLQVRTERAS